MNTVENSISAADTASGIELTRKGIEYAEAQRRLKIRTEAIEIFEGCLELADRMIAVLDGLDDDPDLEPYLAGFDSADDDREVDIDTFECDGDPDAEPSLGWTRGEASIGIAPTFAPDLEQDILDEPHDPEVAR